MNSDSKLSKIIFCFQITSNIIDGFKLILHTFFLFLYSKTKITYLINDKKIISINIKSNLKKYNIMLRIQDVGIFYEIFYYKTYQLTTIIDSKGIILDIGAHIGLATIFIHSQISFKTKYYCIEPSLDNFSLLQYNTSSINCNTLNIGICDYSGYAKFSKNEHYHHNYKLSVTKEEFTEKVQVIPLLKLLRNEAISKIYICKLDIEGAEEKVFNDCLDWLSYTDNLLIELHLNFSINRLEKKVKTKWKNFTILKRGEVFHLRKRINPCET